MSPRVRQCFVLIVAFAGQLAVLAFQLEYATADTTRHQLGVEERDRTQERPLRRPGRAGPSRVAGSPALLQTERLPAGMERRYPSAGRTGRTGDGRSRRGPGWPGAGRLPPRRAGRRAAGRTGCGQSRHPRSPRDVYLPALRDRPQRGHDRSRRSEPASGMRRRGASIRATRCWRGSARTTSASRCCGWRRNRRSIWVSSTSSPSRGRSRTPRRSNTS